MCSWLLPVECSVRSVWAKAKKRTDFLFLEDLPKGQAYHGPFVLPSSQMMLDFCKDLVKLGNLDNHLWQARAESMQPLDGNGMCVTLQTPEGKTQVIAKHVVVARGPSWRRSWPCFCKMLDAVSKSKIFHAWDLFDEPAQMDQLQGKGVIIGGGLTSAHLCSQLASRGHVDLLLRRERKVKQYDLGLSWMGTKRRDCRRDYEQSSMDRRVATNKAVRDGGSITPELNAVITELEKKGQVTLHEWTEVVTASFDEVTKSWTVALSNDEVIMADYLICATGALVDVASDPLLTALQQLCPVQMHAGSGRGWFWILFGFPTGHRLPQRFYYFAGTKCSNQHHPTAN